MPYQVDQLIKGRGMPVCVRMEDAVSHALALMIEHDFSQLPVIADDLPPLESIPKGLVTYEGILRGIRNFKASIEDLRIRDVMTSAPIFNLGDDLFDILDRLKETNAVLIQVQDDVPELVGIVTSYDTTEYFRERTEDLMRVEDIETMIKEFILEDYQNENGEVDNERLKKAIVRVSPLTADEKAKEFKDPSLSGYINLLTMSETWSFFHPIFNVQRESLRELLGKVRETRNTLAHFRGDITMEQRDSLKFATEWLARCQEEYQDQEAYQAEKLRQEAARLENVFKKPVSTKEPLSVLKEPSIYSAEPQVSGNAADFAITESATGGGRYARLADWLQSLT